MYYKDRKLAEIISSYNIDKKNFNFRHNNYVRTFIFL